MAERQEYEQNQATYYALKETIEQAYSRGWFVGIADGRILGAAPTFPALELLLHAEGIDPRRALIVEVGVAYLERVTIFI